MTLDNKKINLGKKFTDFRHNVTGNKKRKCGICCAAASAVSR